MEDMARTIICDAELGEPPAMDTCTPATLPWREFTKLAVCPAVTSSLLSSWTEKLSFDFSWL